MTEIRADQDSSFIAEPRVAVVGVGGAGCNIASSFYDSLGPADVIAINTDRAALRDARADTTLHICKEVTKGEGTRGDVVLGKKCAVVHRSDIERELNGYDAVFIVTGLGGGTGTGASAVVADISSKTNATTCIIAVNPFFFESERMDVAKEGLRNLRSLCKSVVLFENDRMIDVAPESTMEDVLDRANKGIAKYINDEIQRMPYLSKETVDPSYQQDDTDTKGEVTELNLSYILS